MSTTSVESATVGTQLYSRHGFGGRIYLDQVERITKTQLVLKSGLRVNRRTGVEIGSSSWGARYFNIAQPEHIEKCTRQDLVDFIEIKARKLKADSDISTETLRQIAELFKSSEGKAESGGGL